MQNYFLVTMMILSLLNGSAQERTDPRQDIYGEYRANLAVPIIFRIYQDGDKLQLQIVGQWTTELIPLQGDHFRVASIKPVADLAFMKDSLGRIEKFQWTQKSAPLKWTRCSPENNSTYAGKYQLQVNPYRQFHITESEGRLTGSLVGSPEMPFTPLGKGRFIYKKGKQEFRLSFDPQTKELTTAGDERVDFRKVSSTIPHISNRTNGFTRADSLQGGLTPLRTCYDVLFYDLDILVEPETKSIRGNTAIRFKTIHTFTRMQIDLFANMKIEKILFHGQELPYTREYNAVFIDFPQPVKENTENTIRILYAGQPNEPEINADKGGWFWLWNRDHKMWIETVSQGVGASLWWPCKDHLSDRPDSMKISVTFPTGLMEISNGRLLGRTDLPGGHTRCDWYVGYPINNYDVVINIGDYTHFTDTCTDGNDTLALNYYCMSYNLAIAKNIFSRVKPMLALHRQKFGAYPFRKDGFTVMESIYPMEHQGAISIGAINSPFNSTRYDSAELVRLMWHESAHEWWGNSVGCKDYADFWIHESFATYAEVLNYESVGGRQAALKYLHSDPPKNKEPIIGIYNVNHFHMGDMYPKGALMLHTLRNIIDNDSLWFSILRGIQDRFRYQPITTEDLTGYISRAAGRDLTWFFDEYLRYAALPVLMLTLEETGSSLKIKYKWQANRPGFCMPVKVTTEKDTFTFIYPGNDWQTMELKDMQRKDFKVDTEDFYMDVNQKDI